LEKTIESLEHKKTKLENKVSELKSKIDAIEKRNKDRKDVEAKKRDAELEFLKYQEQHLAKFLKTVSEKQKN
jgi:dynein light intermediate chain